jgi:hypothetical protein
MNQQPLTGRIFKGRITLDKQQANVRPLFSLDTLLSSGSGHILGVSLKVGAPANPGGKGSGTISQSDLLSLR